MVAVDRNRQTIMQYLLNGHGERVRKELAGDHPRGRDFVYDAAGCLLAEYTDNGGDSKDYIWAGDTLVAVYAGNGPADPQELQYVYTDGLGTPRALTNANGNATPWSWPAVRNPFGERDAAGQADTLNVRFPWQYFDAETGLHYNYFRDYEPGTGRYVESDPIGIAAAPGTYAYVGSSPLAQVDPRGLLHLTDLSAALGANGGVYCQYGTLKPFLDIPSPWSDCSSVVNCPLKHEQTHTSDFHTGTRICHLYNLFVQVVAYDSTTEMQKYELHACIVERHCLEQYLQETKCTDKSGRRSLIKMHI